MTIKTLAPVLFFILSCNSYSPCWAEEEPGRHNKEEIQPIHYYSEPGVLTPVSVKAQDLIKELQEMTPEEQRQFVARLNDNYYFYSALDQESIFMFYTILALALGYDYCIDTFGEKSWPEVAYRNNSGSAKLKRIYDSISSVILAMTVTYASRTVSQEAALLDAMGKITLKRLTTLEVLTPVLASFILKLLVKKSHVPDFFIDTAHNTFISCGLALYLANQKITIHHQESKNA